jgi:hypothetical protein
MSAQFNHPVFATPELLHGLFDACVLDGSASCAQELQAIIGELAQAPADKFTANAHRVLAAILAHPAWGGRGLAYNHTADRLGQSNKPIADLKETWFYQQQQHYAQGRGSFLAANRMMFGQSQWVQACCRALKKTIANLRASGKPFAAMSTEARDFLSSNEAMNLEKQGNRVQTGFIFADGSLMLEHKDDRAPRTFDRFIISASTSAAGAQYMTRWKLFGQYVFSLPEHAQADAELLLHEQVRVRVPMALAAKAQDLAVAKGFYYGVDWIENWAG